MFYIFFSRGIVLFAVCKIVVSMVAGGTGRSESCVRFTSRPTRRGSIGFSPFSGRLQRWHAPGWHFTICMYRLVGFDILFPSMVETRVGSPLTSHWWTALILRQLGCDAHQTTILDLIFVHANRECIRPPSAKLQTTYAGVEYQRNEKDSSNIFRFHHARSCRIYYRNPYRTKHGYARRGAERLNLSLVSMFDVCVICKTRVRLKENGKDNYVVGGPSFMQRWNDNSRRFAGHTFDDYKGGRMFATICVVCRLLSILLLLSVACCTYQFFAMFTMSDMEHGLGSIGR